MASYGTQHSRHTGQINAVVTAISGYLWWIAPPLGKAAMVWWAVPIVVVLALVVRQRRRCDALASEEGACLAWCR
ncbi:hypothetical protein [Streptomyces sp. NPDC020607]|uniref:hypothetical protein n=1 Tax=Streptomyces sp. NPDC020607 TaxID=3365082 RepID=UPI00379E8C26